MRVIALVYLALVLALAASSTPHSAGSDDVSDSRDEPSETYFVSGGDIGDTDDIDDIDEVDSSTRTPGPPSRAFCRRPTRRSTRRSITRTAGDAPSDGKDAAPLVRRGRARHATANSIARHTSLRLRTATRNALDKAKADGPTTGLFGSAIGRASGARNIVHSGAGGLVRAAPDGSAGPSAGFGTEDRSIPAYA